MVRLQSSMDKVRSERRSCSMASLGQLLSICVVSWLASLWILSRELDQHHHPYYQQNSGSLWSSLAENITRRNHGSPALNLKCNAIYQELIRSRTPGLTPESLDRGSFAWRGNRQRLQNVARRILDRKNHEKIDAKNNDEPQIHIVTFGGSITLANTVLKNKTLGLGGYPELLELRLNEFLQSSKSHSASTTIHHNAQSVKVHNLAYHGADICALEKRMNVMLTNFFDNQHIVPDLILLEFAVNDYQGQDDLLHVDSKTDVFFTGFEQIAMCAEVVVAHILRRYPTTAVAFVEFRTAIPVRQTAATLHLGVAQHYQVPVISWEQALYPEYFHLFQMLNASDRYTAPIGDSILPYPYGCHACVPDKIAPFYNHFRPSDKHCRTVCDFVDYTLGKSSCSKFVSPPPGRQYCHPAMFAVDAVHPSALGHAIATDLILEWLGTAIRDECLGSQQFQTHILPDTGWLAAPELIEARSRFVMVNDTQCFVPGCNKLVPITHSRNFSYYSDTAPPNVKTGWIATNPKGNEDITFEVRLPKKPCYVLHLAILRSYVGMGKMTVEIVDKDPRSKATPKTLELDGLWKAHISVWSDQALYGDDEIVCTGHCTVRVTTKPTTAGRAGNKVKLLTLSARECLREPSSADK